METETNKRTASDCGFLNHDNDGPTLKKIKLDKEDDTNVNSEQKSARKGAKRKVALVVSYLGTNYHGSAMSGTYNESVPTVSGVVFDTLCKIGAISEDNAVDPKKVSFAASSRTDKGVHAAAATFALKMINFFEDPEKEKLLNTSRPKKKEKESENTSDTEDKCEEKETDQVQTAMMEQKSECLQWNEMKDLLNKSLPNDIVIQGIQRTTKNFDPRFKAWSRVYRYLLPTYLLDKDINASDITDLEDKFCESMINAAKASRAKKKKDNDMDMNDDDLMQLAKEVFHCQGTKRESNKSKDIRFGYRINQELVCKLNELCQIYVGTRNYHNFTRKVRPNEDKAKRYIYSMEIINTSLIIDDIEYVQFELHGASFLYHQIRKMIGLLVVLMRNAQYKFSGVDKEDINQATLQTMAFSKEYKMAIPLAPSQGLYLKTVHFTKYNEKCVRDNQSWKSLKLERYDEGVNKFIVETITPVITNYESNENVFAFWLYGLQNDFKYEVVEITPELIKELKKKGIGYVIAGNSHRPIDVFYQQLVNRLKQNKIKKNMQ